MRQRAKFSVILICMICSLFLLANVASAGKKKDQSKKGERDVGGVDLNDYCQRKYGGHAELTGDFKFNAYSWRCTGGKKSSIGIPLGMSGEFSWHEISVNEACQMQYGKKAYSKTLNSKDPYSWRCFKNE